MKPNLDDSVRDHYRPSDGFSTRYCCSQDAARKKHAKKSEDASKHRDTLGMDRFDCKSGLRVTVQSDGVKQTVTVRLQHHEDHVAYFEVGLPPEAAEIIRQNVRTVPASALVSEIQAKFPNVTAAQVHRAWSEMSEFLFKRAENHIESAEALLKEFEEQGKVDRFDMQPEEDVTAVAWGLPDIAAQAKDRVVEVVMDATCTCSLHRDVERES
jgi:hypothetical protein